MDRDRELFAYLETKFEGIDRRLEQTHEQILENRILIQENRTLIQDTRDQVRKNQTEIRENRTLIEDTQSQVRENRAEIRENRAEISENRDRIRGVHVLGEDQRTRLQILAEGYTAQDEKIDRRFAEAESERRRDRDHLEALIKGTFVHLSRRDDDLEERVGRLEAATG